MTKVKRISENELANRNFGRLLTILVFACLYIAGFMYGAGIINLDNPVSLVLSSILGLVLLVGFTMYFYYKGKHYNIEKDNSAIAVLVLLVLIYSMEANLLVLVLVGPLQYFIGRIRSWDK